MFNFTINLRIFVILLGSYKMKESLYNNMTPVWCKMSSLIWKPLTIGPDIISVPDQSSKNTSHTLDNTILYSYLAF